MFIPNACSTPKSDHSSVREDHPVVAEGERRTYIREKEERVDKAMSIYENVPAEHNRANESTVWYEYGCVWAASYCLLIISFLYIAFIHFPPRFLSFIPVYYVQLIAEKLF